MIPMHCSSLAGAEYPCGQRRWPLPSTRPERIADCPNIRFHDIRHFSLTMAAATGASTRELMRRGGHSTPAAALRYQHATEDRDKAIAEALGTMAGGDGLGHRGSQNKQPSRP